jgi:hypothetical protein
MLFSKLMTGIPLLDVMSTSESFGPISVTPAHIVTDGINDHKLVLVLVARNHADRLRQQITKLGYSVKAGSGFNSTGRDTL